MTTVWVYTMRKGGGTWSRYEFPFRITDFAVLGDDLYIRNGNTISIVDRDIATDEVAGLPQLVPGLVQWPWLDAGQPGVTKMVEGFDIVCVAGVPMVSLGYDQRNTGSFTTPYACPTDTVPGSIIPLPVSAPTISLRITFDEGPWDVQGAALYLHDLRMAT